MHGRGRLRVYASSREEDAVDKAAGCEGRGAGGQRGGASTRDPYPSLERGALAAARCSVLGSSADGSARLAALSRVSTLGLGSRVWRVARVSRVRDFGVRIS